MRKIALVMMVKNEQKYAIRSFESVKSFIDTYVIYDTGSTDDTIVELQNWCNKNNKQLHLKEGTFVNFSVSRNVLLRFANEVAKEPFLLLLDANDEFKGNTTAFVKHLVPEVQGGLLKQHWQFQASDTHYWNIRLISNHPSWIYKGAVHEYIEYSDEKAKVPPTQFPEEFVIFQNRNDDGGKSGHRLQQDYNMLLKAIEENPYSARDTFYLARTCDALQKRHEAILYYERRLTQGDFDEELFWSDMGIANNYKILGQRHIAKQYYARAAERRRRVEPLLMLCDMYKEDNLFYTAFIYGKAACDMPFPENDILFVNKSDYDYKRWHILGIVAYYCGEYFAGAESAQRAYNYSKSEVDAKNLEFYKEKLVTMINTGLPQIVQKT